VTIRSRADKEIAEKSVFRYTADLKKEDGTVVASADLSALTLTVYAQDAAQTIINALNAVSILNVGRGTLDAAGKLTIVLAGDDLALVDATAAYEDHVMLIQGTYASGTRFARHEVYVRVVNLAKV
jgi:hypothetical protein